MDIIIGFILSFSVLLLGVLKGWYIGFLLVLCLIIFSIISLRRGNDSKDIIYMAWDGGKKGLIVVKIFLLIGMVTAVWLTAGTVPAIVYYGMKLMNPRFYILFAFLISSTVSYMLGTSFGTVSTVGIALMVMAKGGNINPNLAAGAIISGCYFGDRTSPMSSCANLVSNLTETDLYPMLKKLLKTTILPFLIVGIAYLFLSFKNPLNIIGNEILSDISHTYTINIMVLLPAILMLVLSIFKVDVKLSMIISIIIGIIVAKIVQQVPVVSLFKTIILGYNLEPSNPLVNIIKGGGMLSMMKAGFIVFISCAIAGVLNGIDLFNKVNDLFTKINSKSGLFLVTGAVSLFTAAFGGNQSIAIVMTSEIMKMKYEKLEIDKYQLASDIGNTAVILSPLIPWNISNIIPTTTLNVSSLGFIPYAFYLYFPFIINYIYLRISERNS